MIGTASGRWSRAQQGEGASNLVQVSHNAPGGGKGTLPLPEHSPQALSLRFDNFENDQALAFYLHLATKAHVFSVAENIEYIEFVVRCFAE